MSSTRTTAFSEIRKCELYFSMTHVIRYEAVSTNEKTSRIVCVLVYHLIRFNVAAVCVCVYFTLFSFLLNLFFFFLASSVFRFSSIQIHFSAFVSRCLGDVHETHKHTYIFSCICSFRRTWHINGCIAGCHVFLSYVQCFQYALNRSPSETIYSGRIGDIAHNSFQHKTERNGK